MSLPTGVWLQWRPDMPEVNRPEIGQELMVAGQWNMPSGNPVKYKAYATYGEYEGTPYFADVHDDGCDCEGVHFIFVLPPVPDNPSPQPIDT